MPAWKPQTARDQLIRWARRLSRKWTYFVTLTFRKQTEKEDVAVRRFRSFLSLWARKTQGARPTAVLWSAHHHASGAVHLHALWVSSTALVGGHCRGCKYAFSSRAPDWRNLKEAWFAHYGIARFLPYDDTRGGGAVGYVLRYVLKEECTDWDFWKVGIDYGRNR